MLWIINKWFRHSVCLHLLCLCTVSLKSFLCEMYWSNTYSICLDNARYIPFHCYPYNAFWEAGQVSSRKIWSVWYIVYLIFFNTEFKWGIKVWSTILASTWKRLVIKSIDMMHWLYSIHCSFLNVKWSWCFCFKHDFKNLFFSHISESKPRNCEKNRFLKAAFLFFIALGEGGWRFIFLSYGNS